MPRYTAFTFIPHVPRNRAPDPRVRTITAVKHIRAPTLPIARIRALNWLAQTPEARGLLVITGFRADLRATSHPVRV